MANIIKKECRFAVYIPPAKGETDDYHLVKVNNHYDDGTTSPAVEYIKNYKVKFYVTKKGFRTHTSKKEAEFIDRLTKYETTMSKLYSTAAKALGQPTHRRGLRDLLNNPYIYGLNISSTTLIKEEYNEKVKDSATRYTAAQMDTETDVVKGTGDIIVVSLVYGNKIYVSVLNEFVKGIPRPEEKIISAVDKYIGEYVKKYDLEIEVKFFDNSWELSAYCFSKAHEHKPDFVSFWNINFDMPRIKKSFDDAGIDIAKYICDPSVPEELRKYKYKEGSLFMTTAAGKHKPKDPASQWHTAIFPASFYLVDAMAVYKQTRSPPDPEEPSYKLDYILNKELSIGKLKFEQAEGYVDIDWHVFMQKNYPIEYIVYNIFDSLSTRLLEDKTGDLGITLPVYSNHSDFSDFNSQPSKLCDRLDPHLKSRDMIFGTAGSEMVEELDSKTLSTRGWIVALPAFSRQRNALYNIIEDSYMQTNVYVNCADIDVTAAYPSFGQIFNIAKMTTVTEVIDVVGIPESIFREQGMNLSCGGVNHLEYCQQMFNMPTLTEMLNLYNMVNASYR